MDKVERKMTPVIICSGENGRAVVFGWASELPEVGKPVELERAKMVLYWSMECGGLFGLASNGPKTTTRITCAVDKVRDVPKQVLEVSEKAAAAIDGWPDA
jgi:hypothetical protein